MKGLLYKKGLDVQSQMQYITRYYCMHSADPAERNLRKFY